MSFPQLVHLGQYHLWPSSSCYSLKHTLCHSKADWTQSGRSNAAHMLCTQIIESMHEWLLNLGMNSYSNRSPPGQNCCSLYIWILLGLLHPFNSIFTLPWQQDLYLLALKSGSIGATNSISDLHKFDWPTYLVGDLVLIQCLCHQLVTLLGPYHTVHQQAAASESELGKWEWKWVSSSFWDWIRKMKMGYGACDYKSYESMWVHMTGVDNRDPLWTSLVNISFAA